MKEKGKDDIIAISVTKYPEGRERDMLPKDPMMLYSVINMKLRDFYPSLTALCEDLDESREEIEEILAKAGFVYDKEENRFVS